MIKLIELTRSAPFLSLELALHASEISQSNLTVCYRVPDEHVVEQIIGWARLDDKNVRLGVAILGKLDGGFGEERRIAMFVSAASRLLRAYVMQVEVLRRLRNGGQQFVRVEHVHVNDGGRAVIGKLPAALDDRGGEQHLLYCPRQQRTSSRLLLL